MEIVKNRPLKYNWLKSKAFNLPNKIGSLFLKHLLSNSYKKNHTKTKTKKTQEKAEKTKKNQEKKLPRKKTKKQKKNNKNTKNTQNYQNNTNYEKKKKKNDTKMTEKSFGLK